MKLFTPLCLIILITACTSPAKVDDQKQDPTPAPTPTQTAPDTLSAATRELFQMAEDKGWEYDERLTGDPENDFPSASLKALNAKAYIKLYNHKQLNMIILQLEGGKFKENFPGHQDIKIQFDSAKAETYTCLVNVDGSLSMVKLRDEFIRKLKKSKKVFIEVETSQDIQKWEFNCSGLIWKYQN